MKKKQSLVSIGGFLLALVLMSSSSLLQAQGLSLGENPSSNEPSTGLVGSVEAPESIYSIGTDSMLTPLMIRAVKREVTGTKSMLADDQPQNWRNRLNECVQEQIYSFTNSCTSSFSLSFPFFGLSSGVQALATALNTDPYPLCSDQGIEDNNIDRRCACIAQQTNPESQLFRCGRFRFDYLRTTHYDDVSPQKAGEICQEIVNRSIVESASKNLARYMDTAVVGELLGSVTGQAMTCTAESIRSRFGDKFGRGEEAQGQRECSAQSLGFIMGQIEKTTRNCRDGGGVYKVTCPLPRKLVPLDPVGSDAREAELAALLNATRGLSALPADATAPDQARIDLRQGYEKFINESELASDYSELVTSAAYDELRLLYPRDAEFTAENYKEFLTAQADKKKKAVIAIANYLEKQIGTNPDAAAMLKGMNLADLPDIKEIMAGRADITDVDADKILNSLTGFVEHSCKDSASAMVSECKMLTTGLLHNSQQRKDYACGEGRDSQSSEIMLGALDSNNWDLLVRSKSDPRERAAIEQAMCFQHYTNGGLKTRNSSKSACEQMGEDGLHANLDPKFKSVESLRREFFDVEAEDSAANNQRLSQVSQSFSSCNPFASASNPNVHNTLMDERDAYSTSDIKEALADQKNDHEQRRETVIWGESGYSPSGGRYGSVEKSLGSGDESGLGGSAQDEIKQRVRQRLDSTVTETKDEAANFYENSAEMFKNLADERAAKMSDPVAEVASATSEAPASQTQIDAAQEERDRYDNILAQLDEMRRKNEDLFRRLTEQGIREVKNEEGQTVPITDAFAETNRKIEEQRRRAIEEKERIEETIAQAERAAVARRSAVASAGSSGASGGVSASRPTATATPGESVSSVGASRSPASNNSASSIIGSSASSASAAGSSNQYGPAPIIQGIYLSSSELEKATPNLNLNGRSLNESADVVRQMIEAVTGQVQLPPQYVNGVRVTDYFLQKQPDGETVMVYLVGDQVVVAPVNVAVNAQQGAAREVAEVKEEPAAQSVAPVDSGRKSFSWDFVEQILDSAGE